MCPGSALGLWAYTLPNRTYRLVRTGTANNVGLASWTIRPGADTRLYGTAAGGVRRSLSTVLQVWQPVRRAVPVPRPAPRPAQPPSVGVYYANCDAVRAAGRAPLFRGQPGYRAGLDRDNDGVACE